MAKRFQFTLESVLRHRERLQEKAQVELSRRMAEQAKLEADLRMLQDEYAEQEKARPSSGPGELIMRTISYLDAMKTVIVLKARSIEEAKLHVEDARRFLVARTKETRALEILRDRQRDEFRKAGNLVETKMLDDFGTQQFLRAQGSLA